MDGRQCRPSWSQRDGSTSARVTLSQEASTPKGEHPVSDFLQGVLNQQEPINVLFVRDTTPGIQCQPSNKSRATSNDSPTVSSRQPAASHCIIHCFVDIPSSSSRPVILGGRRGGIAPSQKVTKQNDCNNDAMKDL